MFKSLAYAAIVARHAQSAESLTNRQSRTASSHFDSEAYLCSIAGYGDMLCDEKLNNVRTNLLLSLQYGQLFWWILLPSFPRILSFQHRCFWQIFGCTQEEWLVSEVNNAIQYYGLDIPVFRHLEASICDGTYIVLQRDPSALLMVQ